MSVSYNDYKYKVKIHTKDIVVLHAIRGIAFYAQRKGNKYTSWGGARQEDWEYNNRCATFQFTDPLYRKDFLKEARRILPKGSWEEVKSWEEDN